MRLMRPHNLAYFRWFLEHEKSRLHIAVQTGFHAYSGNTKCVLCDRIKSPPILDRWGNDYSSTVNPLRKAFSLNS